MTESPVVGSPARRFMDDMAAAGAPVRDDGARMLYEIVAVGGPLSGQAVTTGVSVSEVQNWPQVPPHWVHLPATLTFPQTNADSVDCPPGWLRHSREFGLTSTSVPPAVAWLRHVRGLLAAAVTAVA